MTRKLVLSLFTFALAIALGASSYQFTLNKPATVGGAELKAGTIKVELNGNKAILKSGKTTVETDVTVENSGATSNQTSACCLGQDGKYHLTEIRLGGTNTKVLIKETGTAAGGN